MSDLNIASEAVAYEDGRLAGLQEARASGDVSRGHAREEYNAMLRKRAELEHERPRHDPGEPGPAGDPAVSRVVYEFHDHGVRTQVDAIHELSRREGAGLTPGQIAAVLQQFATPTEEELAELDE